MSKRNLKILIFILITIIAAALSLYWLSLLIILFGILFLFFTSENKVSIFIKKKKVVRYPLVFISIFLAVVFLRLFFFGIYSIPSQSMENTLTTGDVILVNKLSYGPLLPRSGYEIPWLNLLWYLNKNTRKDFGKNVWPYYRLSGYTKLKRNDVVVFKAPWDKLSFVIKRVVGMPGDSLQIINNKVYCNDNFIEPLIGLKTGFKVYYKSYTKTIDFLKGEDVLNNHFQLKNDSINYLSANLSIKQVEKLKEEEFIDSIVPKVREYDSIKQVYPRYKELRWSADNYGPVYIPKKGSTISMNDTNFALYQEIIVKFEEVKIEKRESGFYCNNKEIKEFKFSQDYFFMMGDNRHASIDSRYWGFISESNIIGKATLVLYSANNGFKMGQIF
jgi:signal peptidase I